eukprot:gb/GECH01007260.1/.p1 GENE.gb/GECH01007260.1/~~gb/GECH01007260.1/.p1  ORF type:complete len:641 (+),score=189.35 gb/GECH01007260.1/:1-1923(+)
MTASSSSSSWQSLWDEKRKLFQKNSELNSTTKSIEDKNCSQISTSTIEKEKSWLPVKHKNYGFREILSHIRSSEQRRKKSKSGGSIYGKTTESMCSWDELYDLEQIKESSLKHRKSFDPQISEMSEFSFSATQYSNSMSKRSMASTFQDELDNDDYDDYDDSEYSVISEQQRNSIKRHASMPSVKSNSFNLWKYSLSNLKSKRLKSTNSISKSNHSKDSKFFLTEMDSSFRNDSKFSSSTNSLSIHSPSRNNSKNFSNLNLNDNQNESSPSLKEERNNDGGYKHHYQSLRPSLPPLEIPPTHKFPSNNVPKYRPESKDRQLDALLTQRHFHQHNNSKHKCHSIFHDSNQDLNLIHENTENNDNNIHNNQENENNTNDKINNNINLKNTNRNNNNSTHKEYNHVNQSTDSRTNTPFSDSSRSPFQYPSAEEVSQYLNVLVNYFALRKKRINDYYITALRSMENKRPNRIRQMTRQLQIRRNCRKDLDEMRRKIAQEEFIDDQKERHEARILWLENLLAQLQKYEKKMRNVRRRGSNKALQRGSNVNLSSSSTPAFKIRKRFQNIILSGGKLDREQFRELFQELTERDLVKLEVQHTLIILALCCDISPKQLSDIFREYNVTFFGAKPQIDVSGLFRKVDLE